MKHISWNLSSLYDLDEDPRMEADRAKLTEQSDKFILKWKDRRDYLKDPAVLKQALDEYELWKRSYGTDGDEGYYFWLRTQQDQNDPGLKAKSNLIEDFGRKIENDIQFFQLRIAKVPLRLQKQFLSNKSLKPYRHFLERIFVQARFLLSEPEEKILNLKLSTSYYNWIKMTSSFLAKEEKKVPGDDGRTSLRTFTEITSLMNSRKKKVRDSAAHAFNKILESHSDVAEAEINSVLQNKKVDDELRNVSRPDLTRHLSDDISSDVVDALLRSVTGRFNISREYYRLKADLLGVKKLGYHERNVEFGGKQSKFSFSESLKLVGRVLRKLDPELEGIMNDFVRKGRFDVYPRKGKAGGAFCAHHLISQPTFILLNHTGLLQDVLTLAHELGHGINNELIRKCQNSLNFGTPLSTAEVASTFLEDFVLQELLREADNELRLSIMMKKLNDDVSTIFRQVACYNFELELHSEFRKKGYLSKEEIGKLFQSHMNAYMGEAIEQSRGSENWWIYWSHIRVLFYVYSYASGLLISKSLQNSVKKNRGFILKVKEFLSAGLSDSPENIFRNLGIEITGETFWEQGLNEVKQLLEDTVNLARKMKRI